MTDRITMDPQRPIIDDFAEIITERKTTGSKPEKTVIDFRNDRRDGKERRIYQVPIELLRFRKDNGRIASDIYSYERLHGQLDEKAEDTQQILREILGSKDEENNTKLKNSISHAGQIEPAIITCDGFLINGNRRKMTLEELHVPTMKVVILPGPGEEGGPPTIKEIEQIENRYQLQSDGKSEYMNFDRALSIKRKMKAGMTLEEQLRDDPSLAALPDKEFKKELQKFKSQFLGPLVCIDEYLDQLGRTNLYASISGGRTDREGRWYSFIDYYSFRKQLTDDNGQLTKRALDLGVEEDEIGEIENIAFKIIRKKDFKGIKPHEVIRKLPRMLANPAAKKELRKLVDVPDDIEGDPADDFDILDKKWGAKHATTIIGSVKNALRMADLERERETPFTLLSGALKKLTHDNMDPSAVAPAKLKDAMKLARNVQQAAKELESEFYKLAKSKK